MDAASDVRVLYDSGRLPLWVRILCLLFAVVCIILAGDLVWLRLFGRSLISPAAAPKTPLGWFPAVAATMLLAIWFLQLWTGRKRILWESGSRQLIVEDRWLLGTAKTSLAQSDLVSIQVRRGRTLFSRWWDIYAQDSCCKARRLTQLSAEADARAVAAQIAGAIERPLEAV
jgi:hypothetical protein